MSDGIPENHPLRQLFSRALDKAFREHHDLYSPGVASHLGDDVLCDFIHVDRIFRLKDSSGQRLEDLTRMLHVTTEREGPERRIEVDSYIGAFTLFMSGFFPGSLASRRWLAPNPMVSRVGPIFVSFERPLDYYEAEGRNAYGRAAETARLFAPDVRETYTRLAEKFPEYLELLRLVRNLISDDPEVKRVGRLLD
jgi:hypothetical protein